MKAKQNAFQMYVIAFLATAISVITMTYCLQYDEFSINLLGVVAGGLILVIAIALVVKKEPPADQRVDKIKAFTDETGFGLADEAVYSISDWSLTFQDWDTEYQAMSHYTSEGEYLRGSTVWLRIYIAAWSNKHFSADMHDQERIVWNAFQVLYDAIRDRHYDCNEEAIRDINEKYYLNFDPLNFSAWKALIEKKKKGKLKIEDRDLPGEDNDLKIRMRKYDE